MLVWSILLDFPNESYFYTYIPVKLIRVPNILYYCLLILIPVP